MKENVNMLWISRIICAKHSTDSQIFGKKKHTFGATADDLDRHHSSWECMNWFAEYAKISKDKIVVSIQRSSLDKYSSSTKK